MGYANQKLSKAEKNYLTAVRELLAVAWAGYGKMEAITFAQSSVIYIDHRPKTFSKILKEPKGRIARWIVRFQEYDFTLSCKPGSDNQLVVDCLSRLQYRT